MRASEKGDFESYWSQSPAVNGTADYINLDFDGFGEAAERLTAGLEVSYDTNEFQNDITSFQPAHINAKAEAGTRNSWRTAGLLQTVRSEVVAR